MRLFKSVVSLHRDREVGISAMKTSGDQGNRSDRVFMHQLYEEFSPIMYATAKKYIVDQSESEVVVQDSLVKLVTKVKTLQSLEKAALCSYIVYTVKNTAIDCLRRQGRENRLKLKLCKEELLEMPDNGPALDELLCAAERSDALCRAWEELPEGERLLLEGKYFHELSDAELAQFFGCKPASIRMKLTRARKMLLQLIDREDI